MEMMIILSALTTMMITSLVFQYSSYRKIEALVSSKEK